MENGKKFINRSTNIRKYAEKFRMPSNNLLGVLQDAMDSLLPEERELAMKVFGEEMQVSEFAKSKNESRTTVSSRKQRVLEKLLNIIPLGSRLEMVFSIFRATTTYCGSIHV